MDDKQNIGGNAGTDHDEAVLYEGGLQAKGVKAGLTGGLNLDEGDDANVDDQEGRGHEQLGPSVTKESRSRLRN